MIFDEEARYWQEEYRKGNLDDEDMCGETRALLDGTAEKIFSDWKPMAILVTFCIVFLAVCGLIS